MRVLERTDIYEMPLMAIMSARRCCKYLYVSAFLVFFSFTSDVFARLPDEPEITVVADRSESLIGDKVNVEVSAFPEKEMEFLFPETLDLPQDISLISVEPIKTNFLKKSKTGNLYTYAIYRTGTNVIPPLEIKYKNEGEDNWKSILTRQVPVEVKSLLDPESTDIRDIKGLFDRKNALKPFFVSAVLLLVILCVVFLWIKKRRKDILEAAERVRPPDEEAYEKLRELRAMKLPEKGLVKEYYIKLSEIVRYYLEGRFSFRAPEMTTEEFLESLRESPELKIEHKQLLKEFLSHCDMVKFAKYGPTPLEMLDSFSSAEKLVDQTRLQEEGGEQ